MRPRTCEARALAQAVEWREAMLARLAKELDALLLQLLATDEASPNLPNLEGRYDKLHAKRDGLQSELGLPNQMRGERPPRLLQGGATSLAAGIAPALARPDRPETAPARAPSRVTGATGSSGL